MWEEGETEGGKERMREVQGADTSFEDTSQLQMNISSCERCKVQITSDSS